jgi:hypothetical protein
MEDRQGLLRKEIHGLTFAVRIGCMSSSIHQKASTPWMNEETRGPRRIGTRQKKV